MTGRGRGRGSTGRKQSASGELHRHLPHTASTVQVSANGRRALVSSTPVDTTIPAVAKWHAEDHDTARALESEDFSYFLGDEGRWAEQPAMAADAAADDDDDGIRLAPQTAEVPPDANFERWENAVWY